MSKTVFEKVFLILVIFCSFILMISTVFTQGLNEIINFNQTSSANITGIASTTSQTEINQRLNINADGQTWDIEEREIVYRKQKTVEYFIYQDMTQMAANTERTGNFTIHIPEKNPRINSAIIEIKNLIYNTQITAGQTIILGNGTSNRTLLTTAAGPAASGENMFYVILADATPELSYINRNGTYNFTLYTRLNAIRQGENAKLILTYEYDSDSPREVKTVRFFIGQINSTLAVGSSTAFSFPALNLPETNTVVRDSFFETYIYLQPVGTVDEGISINLDGANAISGTPIDNAGATTVDAVFLYKNIFDTSTNHTFNFQPTAGYALHAVGTELVLTYEYDSNSPTQLKTVKYLIGQDGGLYTASHTSNFQREIVMPENNTQIRSVYNKVTFAVAFGTGAGTTAYTTFVLVNSSILGSIQPQVNYTLGLRDEQVSTSTILYNASGLYGLTNGGTVVCSVFSSAATTSYFTGSKGCELTVTYAYNASSSNVVNTVEYFVGQSYNSSLATTVSFPFSFRIPEQSLLIRDAYLNNYGFTGSATAATNTLVSYINVPGYVSQTCNFRNTGEARYDKCWDYVGDNITAPGSYTAVLSSGVTRWFSSRLTLTYTYQIFYRVSVEHNTTISYTGTLKSINVSINFSSNVADQYNMSIYNFVSSSWNSTPCQSISASPGQYYTIWCNVTENPTNYVSSGNVVSVRLNSTDDTDKGVLKEEYVQFYVSYLPVNNPPTLDERSESPPSPTTYSPGATYTFYILVNDPDGASEIALVLFEWLGSNETVTSYYPVNSTARMYMTTKTDLAANPAGYNFRWFAKDSRDDWGNVVSGTYVINKALPSLSIEFSSNPAVYPTQTTASCIKNLGDFSAVLTLFRNGTQVAQGHGNYISEVKTLGAGVWNYSCFYSESQNYSSTALNNQNLQVNKGTLILTITGGTTQTYPYQSTVTATENNIGDADVTYSLWRGNILIATSPPWQEQILFGVGTYTYRFNATGGANWTANATGVTTTVVINQNTSTASFINLTINGTEGNKIYTYPSATNVTAWFVESAFVGPAPTFVLFRNTTQIGTSNPVFDVNKFSAGFYNYTFFTVGNQNYSSAMKQFNLTIQKADITPYLRISVNGTEADQTFTYGNVTNVTAWSTLSGQAGITYSLYRNTSSESVLIGVGSSVSNIAMLGANNYYYIFNTSGNENYTAGSLARNVLILKGVPTLVLSAYSSWSETYPTETSVSCQAYSINNEVSPMLYRNSSPTNPLPSAAETLILGAGSHEYVCNNTETQNYTAAKNSSVMLIGKGNPSSYINLFIEKQSSDKIIVYPNLAEVRGNVSTIKGAEDLIFRLYRNSDLLASGDYLSQSVDKTRLGNGTYIFVYNTTGGANWTYGSSLTRTLYVLKGSLPLYIAINGTQSDMVLTYENVSNVTGWSDFIGEDLVFMLYRNNSYIASSSPASEILLLGAGTYTYVYNTTGGANWTANSTSVTLTIIPKPIGLFLALNGTQANRTYNYPEAINATAWMNNTIGDEGVLTLLRNSVVINTGKTVEEAIILGNGSYNYSVFLSAENYTAASITNRFALVNKGIPPIYLAINGTQGNVSYTYHSASNATGWLETLFKEGSVKLLRDGVLVSEGKIANETLLLGAGEYNYSLVFEETQNYSFASITKDRFLKINKALSTAVLNLSPDSSITYETETTAVCIETNPEAAGSLWRNGTDVTAENSTAVVLPAGIWNYVCNVSETQNYTSASDYTIYIVNKKDTTIYLWLNNSREDKYYVNRTYANFTVELLGYPGKPVELWTNYTTDGQWKIWSYGLSPLENITRLASVGIFNFTGIFSGDENYTASHESWIVTIGSLTLDARIESMQPRSIRQTESSILVGNCSCFGGTCTDVYIEVQADGEPIPNVSGHNLQVNGSASYYIGEISNNSWSAYSWKITGWNAGEYRIRIKCNSTQTEDAFSEEQILQVNDTESPRWLGNLSWPPSPAVYEPDRQYYFNITWYDNVDVSSVLIEHNFTGELVNETMEKEGNEYYFTAKDLPAGTYVWRSYTNDTSGNWNMTDQWLYKVSKAPAHIKLFLNGSESSRFYNVSEVANFTVTLNVSGKTVYLFSNMTGWVLQSGSTPLINYTKLREIGLFNVTAFFPGDENYTASSQTYFASVVDEESPAWIIAGQNLSWVGVGRPILLYANWSDNFDLVYAWLSTNETGEWKNYTAVKLNLTEGKTWSNFTWQNSFIPAGRTIEWRIYANDSSGNENVTDVIRFVVNASEMWNFLTGGIIFSSSAVGDVDNTASIDVVFASHDSNVYALKGEDGQKLWSFSTKGIISSSPSLASMSSSDYLDVFIGSYDYNMYAINGSDGTKLWNFSTRGRIYSSPAIADINRDGFLEIVFGSEDRNVYALNGTDGSLVWYFQTNGRIVSSPALVNLTPNGHHVVFIGSYDYNMYAINGSDGTKLWNFSTKEKVESSPAVDDLDEDGNLEVVFGSYDTRVYVLDANTGLEKWNYTTGRWVTSSPVITKIGNTKKVIISSHNSNVYCFNPDGSLNWTFTLPTRGRAPYLPSVADLNLDGTNDVMVGATDGIVYALNGLDGSILWFYNIGQYIYSSPALADLNSDGTIDISFGSTNRYFYALDPPSWSSFGANERRTRIIDFSPPEAIQHGVEKEMGKIKIYSLWREKFSNLEYAIIEENSSGFWKKHEIKLKGMTDWVNYSFYASSISYRIIVYDEYGNYAIIENFVEGEKDIIPPIWFATGSSEHIYNKGQKYTLNVTWIETEIDKVLIEHNFTGELVNETMNKEGNEYYFTAKDLPAGTYVWRSYTNDTSGNWNMTDIFALKIEKRQPILELDAAEVVYPSSVYVECNLVEGDGKVHLLRNGSKVGEGISISDTERLNAGLWNYVCFYKETQNYTSQQIEKSVTVSKGIPGIYLQVSGSGFCPGLTNVTTLKENEGDSDILYTLYNSSGAVAFGGRIDLQISLRAGKHLFTYSSIEGENWTASFVQKLVSINDISPPKNILFGSHFDGRGLNIYSLWEDECSQLKSATISENSLGVLNNHTVSLNGYKSWVNYTIPVERLNSPQGATCIWIFCTKRIYFSVNVSDVYNNENSVSQNVWYLFIRNLRITGG